MAANQGRAPPQHRHQPVALPANSGPRANFPEPLDTGVVHPINEEQIIKLRDRRFLARRDNSVNLLIQASTTNTDRRVIYIKIMIYELKNFQA